MEIINIIPCCKGNVWLHLPHVCFSENVMTIMANVHSFVLQDCRQSKWAGDTSEEISLSEVKINEKKKEQLKIQSRKMPNRPYSKAIMLENIK